MKRWKQTWIVADSLSCCCQRCVGEKFRHNEWKDCAFCWAALRPNLKSGALKFFPNISLGFFSSRDDYKLKFTRRERKKYSVVEVFTEERPAEDWGAWATPTQCSARQALHYWLLVVQCIVCVCVCVTVYFILYRLLQIFQKCTKPWCRGLSILIQYCTVLRYLAFIYGIVWRFIVTVLQYFAGRCHYIATTP